MLYIQPIFRSHPNFGLYTLKDDEEEIKNLLTYFPNYEIIFVGSSTGCQNILYSDLIKNSKCFLVGPVSDREYEENTNKQVLEKYKAEINNKEGIFCYNSNLYYKERWKDLYMLDGKDDLFSSDLGDQHFMNLNRNCNMIHFVICENDEFMIKDNKEKLRLVPKSEIHILKDADHFLSKQKYLDDFGILLDLLL